VTLKSEANEIQRLHKDLEKSQDSYKKLQQSSKEDIKRLESELRRVLEEGDKKVREQFELSMKKQSLEGVTQQLKFDLD
jgi:hypothetical protein